MVSEVAPLIAPGIAGGELKAYMVMVLDVAGEPVPQFTLEVNIHFTWSPVVSDEVVNVVLLLPTFVPFTCH